MTSAYDWISIAGGINGINEVKNRYMREQRLIVEGLLI